MGKPTVRTEALKRAAAAMGGVAGLAQALRLPEPQIHRWLSGDEYPPIKIYHQALDLLISTGAH